MCPGGGHKELGLDGGAPASLVPLGGGVGGLRKLSRQTELFHTMALPTHKPESWSLYL